MMRRIGSNLAISAVLFSLALAAETPGLAPSNGVPVSKKSKKDAPHGMVTGTVFRVPGFALAGAMVTLTSLPEPASASRPLTERALSDDRGEFAFRVPPVEMHYKVTAAAKGFASQDKTVEIRGEEDVEATFLLEPESNK